MAGKSSFAYVMIEGITSKDGGWTSNKTGEPQVKWNLRCTGKSGNTVWFNFFGDPDKDNTILRDFEPGMGAKVTFFISGDKGQFKNLVGLSHATVDIEQKSGSGGGDQDKIMMQACIKAAGSGVPDVLVEPASISQFIWDVAEDLFLKLNNRRYGASPSASKPASAEMTKEESKTYLEDPPQDPPDPPQEEDDDEVPF